MRDRGETIRVPDDKRRPIRRIVDTAGDICKWFLVAILATAASACVQVFLWIREKLHKRRTRPNSRRNAAEAE